LVFRLSPGLATGGALERIKVRGSALVLTPLNPHPTLSALHPVAIPEEASVA
jgi:hypothetical protein